MEGRHRYRQRCCPGWVPRLRSCLHPTNPHLDSHRLNSAGSQRTGAWTPLSSSLCHLAVQERAGKGEAGVRRHPFPPLLFSGKVTSGKSLQINRQSSDTLFLWSVNYLWDCSALSEYLFSHTLKGDWHYFSYNYPYNYISYNYNYNYLTIITHPFK